MDPELYISELKETYKTYLKTVTGRKNLYSRAMSAIINENNLTKKLSLTITRDIFEEENSPCVLFLDDVEISNKLLKLLKEGMEGKLNFEEFKAQFFSLSKVFKFVYEISQLYSGKKEYWGEFIHLFLFKKKFKDEYLNSKSMKVGKNKIVVTYDNFIKKIKDEYDDKKEPEEEFKKIFIDSNEGTEQIIDLKKEPEKIEENPEISKQNNDNNKSEDVKTNEISSNGNGLDSKESKTENNNEKIIENNKKDESQNMVDNFSHESESQLEKNLEENSQSKKENIENTSQFQKQDDSKIEKIIEENTVLNYLKGMQRYYRKNNYHKKHIKNYESFTPILDKIIKTKLNFQYKDVAYYDKQNFKPDYKLNDKTLLELINYKLNVNEYMGNKNEFGYFCYHLDGLYIESLYSIINSVDLYNYCQIKNLVDDFNNPSEFIQNLYVKSRAMTLEYYINVNIFFEKYNVIQYPRIIFPLGKFKKSEEYLKNEVEIDGAFLVAEPFSIIDSDFPFIFQQFLAYTGSNKMFNIYNENYDINGKTFLKNDLCLLEIKTRFPERVGNDSFDNIIWKMLNKMIIFEQLFTYLGVKYDRIRLILFYDLIQKKNYHNIIRNILNEFGKEYWDLNYLSKIYIQVIYINSSYFVESLKTNSDKIKNLEETLKISSKKDKTILEQNDKIIQLQEENNKQNDKIIQLEKENSQQNDKIIQLEKENKQLQEENNQQNEKIIQLEKENKQLQEENKKLQKENNKLLTENEALLKNLEERINSLEKNKGKDKDK